MIIFIVLIMWPIPHNFNDLTNMVMHQCLYGQGHYLVLIYEMWCDMDRNIHGFNPEATNTQRFIYQNLCHCDTMCGCDIKVDPLVYVCKFITLYVKIHSICGLLEIKGMRGSFLGFLEAIVQLYNREKTFEIKEFDAIFLIFPCN